MVTGSLGCVHAWFFHGCRWDEGWAGFGNRIHRADFKQLALIGPPLRFDSRETKTRVGAERVVIRFEFEFWQDDALVYRAAASHDSLDRGRCSCTFDLLPRALPCLVCFPSEKVGLSSSLN